MVILFIDAESIFRVQNYIFFIDIGKKKKKKSTMIFSLFPKPMVLASKTYGFRLQNLWF